MTTERPPIQYNEDGSERDACYKCHGAGGWHDCGEDCCPCADPDDTDSADWFWCDECDGEGEL
jgi:hypothetical protein